jgi:pantoate--beta-alanine ligase
MNVLHTINEARRHRPALGRLALVPTMGALHAGHLSLIETARRHAPAVAVSIFVNPAQFGANEDFNRYPRPIEADLEKCKDAGVDLVFNPTPEEMYPPSSGTQHSALSTAAVIVDVPALTSVLEGKHRPGHFRGVCQVVAKLFNIIRPEIAVFGQKDYQQFRVLSAMNAALDFPTELVMAPTLRDPDGLALSSRNQYLSADERRRALSISRALFSAQTEFRSGIRQTNRLIALMQRILLDKGDNLGHIPLSIDYVAAIDAHTLQPVQSVEAATVLTIAARVGSTRLIDNLILNP